MGENLIVVGVDGSEGGRRALRWALREALHRGAAVEAVTAWMWDDIDTVPIGPSTPREARKRAARLLDQEVEAALAEWVATPPTVAREIVESSPVKALVEAAASADLLVLGSHGHGRLHHVALGSVSEACIREASCPVVVVPVPHPERRHQPAEPALRG
ncbi:MAG TPA: universal stress protein [Micromonosporaceae bacterium]|jgi:nucleotide-binding universal stress UspA family protein|nr:universal stress protein [Micromonosporaceae bacterium]